MFQYFGASRVSGTHLLGAFSGYSCGIDHVFQSVSNVSERGEFVWGRRRKVVCRKMLAWQVYDNMRNERNDDSDNVRMRKQ